MSECYLCMVLQWKKGKDPIFAGYRMYSTAPWQLGGTSEIVTALFRAEGKDYQAAQDEMLRIVAYLALDLKMPYWQEVWPWVDTDPDAHEKRYALFVERQEAIHKWENDEPK